MGRMAASIGLDEALRSTRRAVEIREELNFMGVGDRRALAELASSYATLGLVLGRKGDTSESLDAYRKSLSMQERIAALHPTDVGAQRTVMLALSHIGDTLGNSHMLNLGRYAEGAATYARVVEKARWLVSVDPADRKAKLDLAFALLRYGNTLRAAGRYKQAWVAMEEARLLLNRRIQQDPANSLLKQNRAFLHFQFAELHANEGRHALGLSRNQEAMAELQELIQADPREANNPRMLLECRLLHPELLAGAGQTAAAGAAALDLVSYLQQGNFTKSREPRLRALVARAYAAAAHYLPEREAELIQIAEATWAAVEKDGLLVPQTAADRETFRKRFPSLARR
jgi:tetratricopeptide (TPR) repeat protein